jgi:hypothetical protein
MAKFLFEVEDRNRLAQTGLLKRFSLNCVGKQLTLEDMRSEKAEKFKELANARGSKEYEMWFLRYIPSELHRERNATNKKTEKRTKKKNISIIDILRKKQRTMKHQKNSYF